LAPRTETVSLLSSVNSSPDPTLVILSHDVNLVPCAPAGR
jgi:hypothetical protein